MTPSHPIRGRPAFLLVLDDWPKRMIFVNLSLLIGRTCLSHFNLFLIITLESRKSHTLTLLLALQKIRTTSIFIWTVYICWSTLRQSSCPTYTKTSIRQGQEVAGLLQNIKFGNIWNKWHIFVKIKLREHKTMKARKQTLLTRVADENKLICF